VLTGFAAALVADPDPVPDAVVLGKMVVVPLMTLSVWIPTPPPTRRVIVLVEPLEVAVVGCMAVPVPLLAAEDAEASVNVAPFDCSVPIAAYVAETNEETEMEPEMVEMLSELVFVDAD